MSTADERIEDDKPVADQAEQERPAVEEPEDPERTASAGTPLDSGEANPADVSEQRDEVPLDDDEVPLDEDDELG